MAITLPESAKKLLSTPMSDEKKEIEPSSSDPMTVAIEAAKPILAKASFGSVVGFCSGYAVKQAGKLAAVVIGTGFIAVQTAASLGYIDVNWTKVKDDAIKSVDTVSQTELFRRRILASIPDSNVLNFDQAPELIDIPFLLFVMLFQDGDGELGADDLKVYWKKVKALLTRNLPNTGGFSLGFLYGIQQ